MRLTGLERSSSLSSKIRSPSPWRRGAGFCGRGRRVEGMDVRVGIEEQEMEGE